jgi:hypothetical protein
MQILVAVDASAATRNVLGAATAFASLLDADVARVHVAGRAYCAPGEVALPAGPVARRCCASLVAAGRRRVGTAR